MCVCGILSFFNSPSADILVFSLKFDQFDNFHKCMVLKVSAVENARTKVQKKSSLETRFLPIRDPLQRNGGTKF